MEVRTNGTSVRLDCVFLFSINVRKPSGIDCESKFTKSYHIYIFYIRMECYNERPAYLVLYNYLIAILHILATALPFFV